MVRDGCTVILGGLLRNEVTSDSKQVPLLGNLPVVGAAFRNKTETTSKHEILVLMTPHIVYEPDSCREGDKAACDFHRRQAVVAEKMSPLGKRYIARKYFRLAQNAWAAGNQETALRMAEMAVQFDPQNRAAIDLRSDIWQGKPAGDHTLPPLDASDVAAPLDGQQMPEWLLNDLEHQPAASAARHPLDPGEPGRSRDVIRPRKLQ
jgi:type IV pilus assembly protein PilQ